MRQLVLLSGIVASFLFSGIANADNWPSRQVRIIVPYAAGGPTDILTRVVADQLNKKYGPGRFLIENRTGAAGSLGTAYVARSPADGYTFILGVTSTHSINPYLYSNIGYDAIKDFAPVSPLIDYPLVVLVDAKSPYKSMGDILQAAREKPGTISFGSAGYGASNHMMGEDIGIRAGVKFTHVPYKGDSAAIQDVAQSRITFQMTTFLLAMPNVQAGRVRMIAISSKVRRADAPELPTINETVPGVDFLGWFGILAPAGTPKDIVNTFATDIKQIMMSPELKPSLIELDPSPSSPEAFAERIKEENKVWADIVAKTGVKLGEAK